MVSIKLNYHFVKMNLCSMHTLTLHNTTAAAERVG